MTQKNKKKLATMVKNINITKSWKLECLINKIEKLFNHLCGY